MHERNDWLTSVMNKEYSRKYVLILARVSQCIYMHKLCSVRNSRDERNIHRCRILITVFGINQMYISNTFLRTKPLQRFLYETFIYFDTTYSRINI